MSLPALSTDTGTTGVVSTSVSVSTGKSTTLTSSIVTTGLPSMTSSSSKSSYTTPVMTIPPSADNPYISRTSSPAGTVFICFGVIAFFLLLATFLAYLISSWRAKRIALGKEINYDSEYKGGYNYFPTGGAGSDPANTTSKIPLLNDHDEEAMFAQMQSSSPYQSASNKQTRPTDVTRMFISPTAEVLNVRKSSLFQDSPLKNINSSFSNPDSTTSNPETPLRDYQRQHTRTNSELESPRRSPVQRAERGRKGKSVIPSMFLEDMLRDD